VTRFTASQSTTTLPIWILLRPNQAPIVNVVATVLVIVSNVPIWIAQWLSGNASGGRL
jgi:putative spermidine/putrescine transport system permease protein